MLIMDQVRNKPVDVREVGTFDTCDGARVVLLRPTALGPTMTDEEACKAFQANLDAGGREPPAGFYSLQTD